MKLETLKYKIIKKSMHYHRYESCIFFSSIFFFNLIFPQSRYFFYLFFWIFFKFYFFTKKIPFFFAFYFNFPPHDPSSDRLSRKSPSKSFSRFQLAAHTRTKRKKSIPYLNRLTFDIVAWPFPLPWITHWLRSQSLLCKCKEIL